MRWMSILPLTVALACSDPKPSTADDTESREASEADCAVPSTFFMDADGDGLLNEEEVAAARELGSLPEAG